MVRANSNSDMLLLHGSPVVLDGKSVAPFVSRLTHIKISPDPGTPGERGDTIAAGPEISELAVVPLPDLLQRLHSTDIGLSASAAATMLETVGPNRVDTARHKSLLASSIERFSNPLVLILLFAATVSAFTGDVASFVIIAVIVLMSVILDVTQEHQVQNAAERLRSRSRLPPRRFATESRSMSLRPRSCPVTSLFSAGDLVPADFRLIGRNRERAVERRSLCGPHRGHHLWGRRRTPVRGFKPAYRTTITSTMTLPRLVTSRAASWNQIGPFGTDGLPELRRARMT